jgi:predicted GH43/DUF377 family glycosyl hydrolase
MIERFASNPLITPTDVKPSGPEMEVMCAFNAGAARLGEETLLLLRVAERPVPREGTVATAFLDPEKPGAYRILRVPLDDPALDFTDPRVFEYRGALYLTSISHLRVARAADGEHFTVEPAPALTPEGSLEAYGIEDPRITRLGEWYYVNYSAISLRGVCTALARTRDFRSWERLGVIFAPDNKDIAIFPERLGGRYWCFHRPSMKQLGSPSMWLASSENLLDWGGHRHLLGPRPGRWDSERVGCGAPPVRTAAGWLQFYHASDTDVIYRMGAVLLDGEEPWRIRARSAEPLLSPEAQYEREGVMPNIVFHNGLVERGDGTADLYYGGADTVTCGARVDLAAVLERLGA